MDDTDKKKPLCTQETNNLSTLTSEEKKSIHMSRCVNIAAQLAADNAGKIQKDDVTSQHLLYLKM